MRLLVFALLLLFAPAGQEMLPVPEDARPPQKGQAYWWPKVCVEYVWTEPDSCDLHTVCGSAQKWNSSQFWEQGVNRVAVCNPECQWIRGVSMYWLYWEWPQDAKDGYWVMGGAGLGPSYNGRGIPETLFFRDESVRQRKYQYVKDFYLHDYKVGWWMKLPERCQ